MPATEKTSLSRLGAEPPEPPAMITSPEGSRSIALPKWVKRLSGAPLQAFVAGSKRSLRRVWKPPPSTPPTTSTSPPASRTASCSARGSTIGPVVPKLLPTGS